MGEILRNRIPFEYFLTKGKGSSDLEVHAGSYHLALYDADICNFNIQTYSSILPKTAKKITKEVIKTMPFGSELYTIMSCVHGKKGEYISCGIIFGELIDDNDEKIGSLVCEVAGNYDEETVLRKRLVDTLEDLHKRTYSHYKLGETKLITNSYVSDKEHGTCLVALCFTSFMQN